MLALHMEVFNANFKEINTKSPFISGGHLKPFGVQRLPLLFVQLRRKIKMSRRAIGSSYKIGSLKIIK